MRMVRWDAQLQLGILIKWVVCGFACSGAFTWQPRRGQEEPPDCGACSEVAGGHQRGASLEWLGDERASATFQALAQRAAALLE